MKKFVMLIAAIMTVGGLAYAGESVSAPAGETSNPINADYGGVEVGTNSFQIGLATAPTENGAQGIGYRKFYASTTTIGNVYSSNRWRVYGVNLGTGTCPTGGAGGFGGDYVSVQVSSSGATQAREVTRFYNNVQIGTGPVCGGGPQYLRWPIRIYGNLFWGVDAVIGGGSNTNPLNRADLLFWKEPE